jgi:hypothetical protein
MIDDVLEVANVPWLWKPQGVNGFQKYPLCVRRDWGMFAPRDVMEKASFRSRHEKDK